MAAIAILDDYQNAALRLADWSGLQKDHKIVVFKERLPDIDAVARALADFEIVGIMRERTPFPRALIERLPRLKLLVTTGKRNASIDMEAAKAHGMTVCNTGGSGHGTADLAIGLMIALARHFREEFAAMRPGGGWQTTLGMDLDGKTLGILGLGSLGTRVARIGAALGMQPIAWSQNLTAEQARERGAERVEKDELFQRADVISIHMVLSDRSRGLVGGRELALMKPTALLINTSRGPLIDEPALIAALKDGRIGGFGGDTFNVEPLPADHPLRAEPRALLTPHLGYVTENTYRDFYVGMVQVIEAWLAGRPINVMA
ncbi:MAG TPA: D-2-hydroxyacid dehydrogenase family protein [Hyphomicrobiaceae bacterium]|nr:D-2-hydroxyacid dehydrogenase family protein [Hyphomicrobiaceae bacterium]